MLSHYLVASEDTHNNFDTKWLNGVNAWSAASTQFCETAPYTACGVDGRKATDDANASVQSWDDMRYHALWPNSLGDMVDLSHAQGMQRIGTLSNIWFWHKQAPRPASYDDAISRDPFGNVIDDGAG